MATHDELCKACEHWDAAVGERKIKQLADLLLVVEDQLNTSKESEVQLAGAMAAWELATDKSHHDRITDDFLLALQSALVSDDFAVACHAAAALHMLRGMAKVLGLVLGLGLGPPGQRPSSAPVPPQGAPGGSGQLGASRKRSGQPLLRVLELAASKAANSIAFGHSGCAATRRCVRPSARASWEGWRAHCA